MTDAKSAWVDVLSKLVLYVGIPIGVLILVYKVITDWLMGPVNALKDLWWKQYEDFVRELKEYSEEDNGNLTPEHQTILYGSGEKNGGKAGILLNTERSIVNISKNTSLLPDWAYWIIFGIILAYVAPPILKKWKDFIKKNDVQSGMGQAYIATCMLADDFANKGYIDIATNLTTVLQERFNTIDAPYMQSQITYYQSQLPNLVGWELLYAQWIIQAYQIELVNIPIWFTYLPPPILRRVKT